MRVTRASIAVVSGRTYGVRSDCADYSSGCANNTGEKVNPMLQDFSREFAAIPGIVVDAGLTQFVCDIQKPNGTVGPSGAPSYNWAAIPELSGLVAMAAPLSAARISTGEKKETDQVLNTANKHVWLAGYYPEIAQFKQLFDLRCMMYSEGQDVNSGIPYDVIGAESDSQSIMTRMELRAVSV